MSHEIDTTTGSPAIAYKHETPWHGLGTQIQSNASVDEWRTAAKLDWEAVQEPVVFATQSGDQAVYPGRFVLRRSDTNGPLSIVSGRYKPVQPTDVLEFFREMCDELGIFEMETVGALRDGRSIWGLARSGDKLKMGTDVVHRYLLLATSYDQSMPTIVQQTSTRVVCANTLEAAWNAGEQRAEPRVKVSHLTTFDSDAVKQRMALDESWKGFLTLVEAMAAKQVTDADATRFFMDTFFPEALREKDYYSEKGAVKRVAELKDIATSSPGSNLKSAKGTVWGLLNAVTYYADHVARSTNKERRLEKAWFGDNAGIKSRALQIAAATC